MRSRRICRDTAMQHNAVIGACSARRKCPWGAARRVQRVLREALRNEFTRGLGSWRRPSITRAFCAACSRGSPLTPSSTWPPSRGCGRRSRIRWGVRTSTSRARSRCWSSPGRWTSRRFFSAPPHRCTAITTSCRFRRSTRRIIRSRPLRRRIGRASCWRTRTITCTT